MVGYKWDVRFVTAGNRLSESRRGKAEGREHSPEGVRLDDPTSSIGAHLKFEGVVIEPSVREMPPTRERPVEDLGGSLVSQSSLAAVHGFLSVCKTNTPDDDILFPTVPLLSISGGLIRTWGGGGGGIRATVERDQGGGWSSYVCNGGSGRRGGFGRDQGGERRQ